MKTLLVTGATGFVGRRLCALLNQRGYRVRAAVRGAAALPPGAHELVQVGDLAPDTDWSAALAGADVVMHLAARAHILDYHDEGEYLRVNGEGTGALARAAAAAGVRRFIYLSSIKVYGDHDRAAPFSLRDVPEPTDVYGRSKLLGEKLLHGSAGGMQVAVVRPPLVYGPEVRANFLRLLGWVDRELPLPLGAVHNARSLVALDNLCDFLIAAAEHPRTGTWLVSDGEDVSTPQLIRELAIAMQRRARLLPVPPLWLRAAGSLVGRGADVMRLCGSLTLDVRESCEQLGWQAPVTRAKGLEATVRWYRETRGQMCPAAPV